VKMNNRADIFLHKKIEQLIPSNELTRMLFIALLCMILAVISMASCSSPTDPPPPPPPPPVDTVGPAISIINPLSNAKIGDTVTLRISSPDSMDIVRVEFFANNLLLSGGVDSILPFEYAWSANGMSDGQAIEFSARAFDSAGNNRNPSRVTATYTWAIRPAIISPKADFIAGDNVTITAEAVGNGNAIAYVEFLLDGAVISGSRDSLSPFTHLWDASMSDTASVHQLSARAVDVSSNSARGDDLPIHYLWRQLLLDTDESWDRDISTLSVRSTATKIHFRITTNGNWTDYRSETNGLACAIFLDTDQNVSTGATGFKSAPFTINDIGADYRLDVGFFGDSIWIYKVFNVDSSAWVTTQPLTGVNVFIGTNSNQFELRVDLASIGNPTVVDIVSANIALKPAPLQWDFAPNQGSGHVTYVIDGSFGGAAPIGTEEYRLTSSASINASKQQIPSPLN